MSETPNTPPPGDPVPYQGPSGEIPDQADVEKNKVFALLSYLGILWLVPLLAAKDSPFAKFHANQGLALFLASTAILMVMVCGGFIFPHIPVIGGIAWCMTCLVYPIVSLAILAYVIMGIVNAVNGKMKPLPGFPVIKIIK